MLTVSDAPQFAEQGGIIGFFLEDNRVRFTVNLTAARQAGLQLNSDLLRVAASVLTGLARRDHLFHTATGRRLWEDRARANLRRELAALDNDSSATAPREPPR